MMKRVQLFAVITLSLLLLAPIVLEGQNKKRKHEEEVTFSVLIDCAGCQKKLEAKLPHERGVKDLKISLEKQTVWLLFDSRRTDKEKLSKALDKLGYKAEEVKEER